MDNVVRVPRASIRRNNEMVFVNEDNLLEIEGVTVLHNDARYSYVDATGVAGRRICLTAIESPINGMRVRTTDDVANETAEQTLVSDGDAQ